MVIRVLEQLLQGSLIVLVLGGCIGESDPNRVADSDDDRGGRAGAAGEANQGGGAGSTSQLPENNAGTSSTSDLGDTGSSLPPLTHVVALAPGYAGTLALLEDGTVLRFGLAPGSSSDDPGRNSFEPVVVPGITNATSVVMSGSGYDHACALLQDGTVECWGGNSFGELGNGSIDTAETPTPVVGVEDATAIASGVRHVCALLSDDSVTCWGSNSSGELGDGTTSRNDGLPVLVGDLDDAVAISAGGSSTCAVTSEARVKCWGAVIGGAANENALTPVEVEGLSGVETIAVGGRHACALLTDGTVSCWGGNGSGQLGEGTTVSSLTPVEVMGLSGVVSISAVAGLSCAVRDDGEVLCWGSGLFEMAGSVAWGTKTAPSEVGVSEATAVWQGETTFACARLKDTSAVCWGNNPYGQLGTGNLPGVGPNPVVAVGVNAGMPDCYYCSDQVADCCAAVDGTESSWGIDCSELTASECNASENHGVIGMNCEIFGRSLGQGACSE